VRLEGLDKLKKLIYLIGSRTRELPACSVVPQLSTLPHRGKNEPVAVFCPTFPFFILMPSCTTAGMADQYLEFRAMDKAQKPSDSECYTPSSEPFRYHITRFNEHLTCNLKINPLVFVFDLCNHSVFRPVDQAVGRLCPSTRCPGSIPVQSS
jgi:hypothetical protein